MFVNFMASTIQKAFLGIYNLSTQKTGLLHLECAILRKGDAKTPQLWC